MFNTEKLKDFSFIKTSSLDHEDFEKLYNTYKIDENTIVDILDPDEQPRVETEDEYKVIIVRFPIVNRETGVKWHTEPLSIIYSKKQVLTVCRKYCDILDKVKNQDKKSPELLVVNIIYYIAESYLKNLKELNKKVLDSKKELIKKISKKELIELLNVENSYVLYMAGLKGNQTVIEKLEKIRGFKKTEELIELIEDIKIEFNQAIEVITSYRKMLSSIKETFESFINIDSNKYINRLTIWNIILIVPTIIVGFYGMNLKLPFEKNEITAIVILIVILILILAYGIFIICDKNKSK